MNEPLKVGPGVLCEVVGGLHKDKSPNLGMVVLVTRFVATHERFGPIWEANSEYGERPDYSYLHRAIEPGHQDYAESWLKPLPREKQPPAVKTVDNPVEERVLETHDV